MTFAEADAQYELIKLRFLGGELTDEQYDEQLRHLMVLDDGGRWWAKSRENGTWHYYDAGVESWLAAVPPIADVPPSLPPALDSTPAPLPAGPEPADSAPTQHASGAEAQRLSGDSQRVQVQTDSSGRPLPRWAAVAPASLQQAPPGAASKAVPPAPAAAWPSAKPPGAGGGYDAQPFSPLPELGALLKIVFYLLSLAVPLLGFVFYAMYRQKAAPGDRSAARVCLILGIISLVLYGMCGGLLLVAESILLGAGA